MEFYYNKPLQSNYTNRTRTPQKYYPDHPGHLDHDNELSAWVSKALPSSESTSTSTSNLSVQQLSFAEVATNFPIISKPRHTSRPSGGQATHTCIAQTQSPTDTPTYATPSYASIASSTRMVASRNLSPSQQSQSTSNK